MCVFNTLYTKILMESINYVKCIYNKKIIKKGKDMKKVILLGSGVALATLLFTGCAKNSTPISLYQAPKDDIVLNIKQDEVKKGTLILQNGDKIFDNEGDIVTSFKVNNKLYYIVQSLIKGESHFKVKNSSKDIVEEFKANKITWFNDDNKFVLAVKLERNKTDDIYDNIYEFDGNKFNLINKNLDLTNGYFIDDDKLTYNRIVSRSGMYYIESLFEQFGNLTFLSKQYVTNISTDKKIDFKKIKTNYEIGNNKPIILGIRNDIIIYTYSTGSLFTLSLPIIIIEAYDMKMNKAYTIYSDNDSKKIQFLNSGNDVVLKIFDNTKIQSEVFYQNYVEDFKTKYMNESAKTIHLNSLKEIKNISDSFKVIPLKTYFKNISGNTVNQMLITFQGSYLMNISSTEPLF